MLVGVPKGIDPVSIASAGDNMVDGYRAVAPLLAQVAEAPVLVVGGAAKSVGLSAAGIAVALGSSQVDYIDSDRDRLAIAEDLGARAIQVRDLGSLLPRRLPRLDRAYPITVEASSTARGLTLAIDALAPGGTCTAVAFYMRATTPLPLWRMYMKSASLHVGLSNPRAHLPPLLDLIRGGGFDPAKIPALVGDWTDADRILREAAIKVVVQRPRARA